MISRWPQNGSVCGYCGHEIPAVFGHSSGLVIPRGANGGFGELYARVELLTSWGEQGTADRVMRTSTRLTVD